jgi:hypothetical protein
MILLLPHPLPACPVSKLDRELRETTCWRGRVWGRSQIIRPQESMFRSLSFNTLISVFSAWLVVTYCFRCGRFLCKVKSAGWDPGLLKQKHANRWQLAGWLVCALLKLKAKLCLIFNVCWRKVIAYKSREEAMPKSTVPAESYHWITVEIKFFLIICLV